MRKYILSFLLFSIFIFFPVVVNAQEDFFVDITAQYLVDRDGKTLVRYITNIENATSDKQALSYVLFLNSIDPKNIKIEENSKILDYRLEKENEISKITINLNEPVAGKGKKRTFTTEYYEDNFAKKTGEIWEISIPRLQDESKFRNYDIIIEINKELGNEAYISPDKFNKEENKTKLFYTFKKEDISKTGVNAGFGKFQIYNFNLIYHLENPLKKESTIEIAIPPDTSFQKIYYDIIEPEPKKIFIDTDGNWIASYNLKSRERIDVNLKGNVQLFASPIRYIEETRGHLIKNTLPTNYWQSGDEKIKEIAQRLQTPEEIYKYVTKTLRYDIERVKSNAERFGAKRALENPNQSLCMEFTDLFIALSRAAGIPAREINGYAYTENPKIQPLSLVADVLHSWPEYWDDKQNIWTPVDPTWGSTTGGVDYFNKLDFRHFTFVIHGLDDIKPYAPGSYKLGPNPQKDVFVNFAKYESKKMDQIEITYIKQPSVNPLKSNYKILLKNTGGNAVYDKDLKIFFNDKETESEHLNNILPFSVLERTVSINYGFLGTDSPDKINIKVANNSLDIDTKKQNVVVQHLIIVIITILIFILVIIYKLRHIHK